MISTILKKSYKFGVLGLLVCGASLTLSVSRSNDVEAYICKPYNTEQTELALRTINDRLTNLKQELGGEVRPIVNSYHDSSRLTVRYIHGRHFTNGLYSESIIRPGPTVIPHNDTGDRTGDRWYNSCLNDDYVIGGADEAAVLRPEILNRWRTLATRAFTDKGEPAIVATAHTNPRNIYYSPAAPDKNDPKTNPYMLFHQAMLKPYPPKSDRYTDYLIWGVESDDRLLTKQGESQERYGSLGASSFRHVFDVDRETYRSILETNRNNTDNGLLMFAMTADDFATGWLNGQHLDKPVPEVVTDSGDVVRAAGRIPVLMVNPDSLNKPDLDGVSRNNVLEVIAIDKYNTYQSRSTRIGSIGDGLMYSMLYLSPKNVKPLASISPSRVASGQDVSSTHRVTNPSKGSLTVTIEKGLFNDANNNSRLDNGEKKFNESTHSQTSSNATIDFGTIQRAASLDDFPSGRICAYTLIKSAPTASVGNPNPAIACADIGKTPLVNILGGDTRVGGFAVSSSAEIKGSKYGSWTEYGLFANATVRNFASGGALSSGVRGASTKINSLTFANQPTDGVFGGSVTRTQTVRNIISAVDGVYTNIASDISLNNCPDICRLKKNGSSQLTINESKEVRGTYIINAPDSHVKINGNIEYHSKKYSDVKDMPLAVINAKTIEVSPDVTRIDAIIHASGVVSTCGRALESGDYFNDLSIKTCDKPLTINGQISADKLQLRRTAGASGANDAELSSAAETINLRADSYLKIDSLMEKKRGMIRTISVSELPPRL